MTAGADTRGTHRSADWFGVTLRRLLYLVLFATATASAQQGGTVAGIVVSTWDGTPLPGVIVTVRGTTLATQTDAAGRYELKNVPPGDQVLRFSKPSYAAAVVTDVRVLLGQTTTVNGNLRPEFFEMEEYEVTAEEFTEQTAQILFERQQSVGLSDIIGSEQFSKYGASDAAEALSRVTGLSVAEGKFAVIRGLADRYTGATVNGAEIPTADPYRKAAQLDLFPAALIDRVEVRKSFTPDQLGNSTGGSVDIVTKSFPEKFVFTASAGVSYNTQANLNDRFASAEGGSTDFAGFDDGTRALPDELAPFRAPGATLPPPGPELDRLTRSFKLQQYAPVGESQPLNHNFSAAIGDKFELGGQKFGFYTGISYNREYSFYEAGKSRRFDLFGTDVVPTLDVEDTRGVDVASWGTLVGLAYLPHENHELGFNFLYAQFGENEARRLRGTIFPGPGGSDPSLEIFDTSVLHYTERQVHSFQLSGKHTFPALGRTKVDWLASLANTTQDEPDLRYFAFIYDAFDSINRFWQGLFPQFPSRFFRDLNEDNQNLKMNISIPFTQWSDLEGELKFGGYHSLTERTYREVGFFYNDPNGLYGNYVRDVPGGDPNRFLPEALASPNVHLARLSVDNRYEGRTEVIAGYGMTDLPLFEKLRFIGGVRYEITDIEISSVGGAIAGTATSMLQEADILPSVGLLFTPITNMNVRLSFGQTIARPTFREMALTETFDFVGAEVVRGNPDLKRSQIDNYDIRWEWFRRPGEVFAASFFYKEIVAPIERQFFDREGKKVTFENRESGTLMGFEIEARSSLDIIESHLKNFNVGFNFAYIQSETALTVQELGQKRDFNPSVEDTRPLYDQAPYIINADITYDDGRTAATLAYNVVGERLDAASVVLEDIYLQPAASLDFSISQRLGKHWKIKFSAKNLLDPTFKRTYGAEPEGRLYSSHRRGRTFGLSLGCDF
jgi:outer membrane receptor protein involved in Fe transport